MFCPGAKGRNVFFVTKKTKLLVGGRSETLKRYSESIYSGFKFDIEEGHQ